MDLTITSVLSTVLLDSLLILALCFFFKIGKVSRWIKPECMIGILLTAMCRLFIPLEFPYTRDIPVEDALTSFRRLLPHKVLTKPFEISVSDILCMIWALGIVVAIIYNTYVHRKVSRLTGAMEEQSWENTLEKYGLKEELMDKTQGIRLACCGRVTSPCMTGLLKPCVILPKEEYPKEYYRYIFLHELMHVHRKDIAWKIMIDILCILFWWDFILWYLRKQLFILIEARNDLRISGNMTEEEKRAYERCLADVALRATEKNITFTLSFHSRSYKELKRRYVILEASREPHYSRLAQTLICVVFGVALFISSAFIIEPYSWDWDEGVPIEDEDMYLIVNGDGYDVYVFGTYTMTTDSLEGFENVEIYKNIKEAEENEKRNDG